MHALGPSLLVLTCAALALAGCATAAPAARPPAVHAERVHVPLEPQDVLTRLSREAGRAGHRVANESVNSLHVDLGVRAMRVDLSPPGETAAGARDTEVHGEAVYVVDPAPDGATVTLYSVPSYWHPDRRVWLSGPTHLAPGRSLLRAMADTLAVERALALESAREVSPRVR